jgi:hypothetical protein
MDAHMTRLEAHMETGNDEIRRNREDSRQREAEQRRFTEEMLLRFDKIIDRMDRRLDVHDEEHRRVIARLDAQTAEIHDQREQIRANTQAVLKALDRLDNGGAAAA